MPQKKNPDAGELLRGKAPRIVGHLQALHGVMHALPLTYNKDLQEDKEHLFDSVDTLAPVPRRRDRDDRRRALRPRADGAAASDELIAATDLADLLVKQGTPFRESHGVIAGLVREAVEAGKSLADVAVPALGEDARAVLAQSSWLESKASEGGTALARVREQLEQARARCCVALATWRSRRLLRPPGPRGRPGPRRLRRRARRLRGRDRRDRGLPPLRAGLPRLRRADGAHVGRSSATRARPTSTAPTGSTRCSTRSASTARSAPPS